MQIVQIIRKDLPNFTGICIREGYNTIEEVRSANISLAWTFNWYRAINYKNKGLLIAGYGEDKGKYFTATIKEILSVREAYHKGELKPAIERNNEKFDYWISHHLSSSATNNPIDNRYVIVFENPSKISYFSEDFSFARSSFYYIHGDTGNPNDYSPIPQLPVSRLKHLWLKGFKDATREVDFHFSEEAITVIHGENGSGKTTFLKLIQAILKKDIGYLRKENVQAFVLTFVQEDGKEYTLDVDLAAMGNEGIKDDLALEEMYEVLYQFTHSVLISTYRGMTETQDDFIKNIYRRLLTMQRELQYSDLKSTEILTQIIKEIPEKINFQENELKDNHVEIEGLSMDRVEEILCKAYDIGSKTVLKGMSQAFFSAIDRFLSEDFDAAIPVDFEQRFQRKRLVFENFVNVLQPSPSQEKLKKFVASNDVSTLHKEKDLFKALVINLLLQAEKEESESIELNALDKLVNDYNAFLIQEKRLELDAFKANIALKNGVKHPLKTLSSGERHLLSLLTIFMIHRRENHIFLIDEPEISLSMEWQRKLLALLRDFAPHAQVIVATHSPKIADGNVEYLRKLVTINHENG